MTRYTYVITVRGIKDDQFTSEPGITTFIAVPDSQNDFSPIDTIKRDIWRSKVAEAAEHKEDPISKMRGDILFFVHGYNNDTQTVLWRTRALQRCLEQQGWGGLVVGFDWPSDNSTLNYLEDRSDASQTAFELIKESLQLLVSVQNPRGSTVKQCLLNVHLIGHSTGAYVIMEAFSQAEKQGRFFKSDWRIGQVVFIGGDIASSALSETAEWANPMYKRVMRLTNYSNRFDKVLAISNAKRLGASPRAGRVGLPDEGRHKAVNVDCSDYFSIIDPDKSEFCGTFCHSWHIGDQTFALDLAMTLEGDIDREILPTRLKTPDGLILRSGSRPLYQSKWLAAAPGEK